jgi:hypothetical protein
LLTVAASLLMVLVWGAVAGAQETLSEAARGLSLERPESDQLLVVESAEASTGHLIGISGAEAVDLAERALAAGRRAEAVLAETRTDDLFYDAQWRSRMLEACHELDMTRRSLDLVQPPGRYVHAFAEVVTGAGRFQVGGAMLRSAISQDEPLYGGAFDQFGAAARHLLTGLVDLRLELEHEQAERTAPQLDPFGSRQTAMSLCAERYGEPRGSGYDQCMAQQTAAYEAMSRRFGFSVGLDEATFNAIRHRCRAELTDDLVALDRCELSRIEAARAGQ